MAIIPMELPKLTTTELATVHAAIDDIKAVLLPKFINLDGEDRKKYGSINEQNKLFVNKVKAYNDNQPDLSTPKVNWADFNNHHATRANYEAVTNMLGELMEMCTDPRTLVDYTLYGMALQDYRYTKFSAEDGGPSLGYETKNEELAQFFAKESAPAVI